MICFFWVKKSLQPYVKGKAGNALNVVKTVKNEKSSLGFLGVN